MGQTATLTVQARVTGHGTLENLARIGATGASDGTRSSRRGDVLTTNDTARAVVTTPQAAMPVSAPVSAEPAETTEPEVLPVTGPAAAPALLIGLLTTLVGLALLTVRRRRPAARHR
jgi:hypothetical protein